MDGQTDAAMSNVALLKKRTFLPLFLTQFFGAFNDNAFKLAILTLVSYYLSATVGQSERYQAIASALFILPFFLFSATAGQLADNYDKARLIRMIKLFEVGLMTVGGLAIYTGHSGLMLLTLCGLGTHSTFFGPIKYAILPEQLPTHQLLGATALIEASSFAAILLGTTLGTLSVSGIRFGALPAIVMTCIAAVAGLTASWFIPSRVVVKNKTNVDWNIWRSTRQLIQQITQDKKITIVIFAISWFWLIGTIILMKLPDFTHYILQASSSVFAVFLALFSVGLACGALVINRCLAGEITLRFVPHSMALLSVFLGDLYWASPETTQAYVFSQTFFSSLLHLRIGGDLFMVAFCSGLFIVPMYTYLQVASEVRIRARTIAANNIFNSLFMVLGSLLVMALLGFHVTIPQVFLIFAIVNFLISIVLGKVFKRFIGTI